MEWRKSKLKLKIVIIFLFFVILLSSVGTALKCHDCTSWEGGKVNFKPNCDSHPDDASLKDGYAGCLEVWGYMGDSQPLVVRGGYHNKQIEGRGPSCYHQNQVLVVEQHVETIRFDSILYCHVCDDENGCNTANWKRIKNPLVLIALLIILLT